MTRTTSDVSMKPLEIILGLSRVRLPQKVPIVEAAKLLELYIDKPKHQQTLLRHAKTVTEHSYLHFSDDETNLIYLGKAVLSSEYLITETARTRLSRLVNDVCGDRIIYNKFQKAMTPLLEVSDSLEQLSMATKLKAGSAERKAKDMAGYVGVEVHPTV